MADPREKAIKAIEKRLKKQPGSPLFARLADYYLEDGRVDDALRLCKEGLTNYPNYTTGLIVKGRALIALGKKDEARKSFNKVNELLAGIEAVEKMLAEVGGPEVAVPPAPVATIVEPVITPAEEPPLADHSDLTPEANFTPIIVEPTPEVETPAEIPVEAPMEVQPQAEETQEEFMARLQQELAGTENTLSLDEYLSGNTPATGSNDIEELAGKLQGAKITPVIDISRPAEDGAGGNAGFVTPTLAEIYVKQGWYDDAIKAYKSLAASKPEEKAQHEARIAEIEAMKAQQQG